MTRSLARAAVMATLCSGLLGSTPAAAQPHDRAAGEALFEAGRDLMSKGQFDAACKKFEASQRSDPALGTLMNLANCYEKAGRLASAWERFEEAAQKLPPGDDRLAVASARAAALKPRLPKLELTLDEAAPKGTQVLRDDVVIDPGALGVAIPLDPGAHRIVVKAPGRSDLEVSVDLREGQVVKRLLAVGAPGAGGAAEPGSGESWWSGKRMAGVAVGGVGVVGLATSLGMGAVAIAKKSIVAQHCNTTARTCDSAAALDAASAGKSASTVSSVAFALGVAALGTGIVLVVIGAPDKGPAASVGGVVLPGGGAFAVSGAF